MKTILTVTLILLSNAAWGQGIYRCGSNFSQQPCGADAKVIQAAPVHVAAVKPQDDVPPADSLVQANKLTCAAAVRVSLKDPDAARIGAAWREGAGSYVNNGKTFHVVSYYVRVNGKNSYGAYTGERTHLCSFDASESRLINVSDVGRWIK